VRIQPMPGALRAVVPCCACRRPIWFRRTGGFAGGLPVLSWRDQPQRPPPPLPLGHERRRVGGLRAAAAASCLAGGQGRPPVRYCMRDVVDGIRYLTHNGPVSRALPADFPPAWTVYHWAAKWQADSSTQTMHDQLRDRVRQVTGRKTAPTAAIIDSQSVKAAEEVARAGRGYDAGKKINGRKRHIAVDTIGLLLTVLVTAASVQDRDAAKPLLWNLKKAFPKVRLAWADGGYAGKLVTWSRTALKLTLEIVNGRRADPPDHGPLQGHPVSARAAALGRHPGNAPGSGRRRSARRPPWPVAGAARPAGRRLRHLRCPPR
jgi:transposase